MLVKVRLFEQLLFVRKMWVGPNGERPLLPKDKWTATMISTFIVLCRDHGLIQEIEPEILAEVKFIHDGEKYAGREAVTEINTNCLKTHILDNLPFKCSLRMGKTEWGSTGRTTEWSCSLRMRLTF